jgi:uncharacterized protein YbjT (DUF2867 family)
VLPGAAAIFLNLPPALQSHDLSRIGEDIARAGIATTVLLSSLVVRLYPGSVMASSHEREESVLGAILGDSLIVLRPGAFMDNDAAEWSASIREDGVVVSAFPDALELPIAVIDIAAEAVTTLTAEVSQPDAPRLLLGPEWLSACDRVALLAEALGQHIGIREVSADEHVALLARVRPEPIARQKVMMLEAAPRSIADCPQLALVTTRTRYAVWAAANTAAFAAAGR